MPHYTYFLCINRPANMLPTSSLGSYIYNSDPALKILQQQRVPLWLTLPDERKGPESINNRLLGDETTDALRWAQTLGDAASGGFDVVFKRMSLEDFERPNFSYYVTAIFKKVMGSRVFPARPLNVFAPTNKLYTHCANAVSGGLAFMVVNTEEQPTTITVRSTSRLSNSDIWQYVLTSDKGQMRLNNVKLSLNSTLRPLVTSKDSSKKLQLITPSMSVGFWVLPSVNLEHCQYSEIEADSVSAESSTDSRHADGYSSADRLLQRLIEETAVSRGSLQSSLNRPRRFVLDNPELEVPDTWLGRLLQPFNRLPQQKPAAVAPVKRHVKIEVQPKAQAVRPCEALNWLRNVMEQSRDALRHRRSRRSSNDYAGPFFYNRQGKKTTVTKKITEIRKPERKVKPLFDLAEFDEEEFFKKMGEQPEPPPYTRLPEGDVHLKHIETPDGEESEMQPEPEPIRYKKRRPSKSKQLKILQRSREEEEIEDVPEASKTQERQKLRLLPTEFFEALPAPVPKQTKRLNLGATLNSLLFPEPFSNKGTVSKSQGNNQSKQVEEPEPDVDSVEGDSNRKRSAKTGNAATDFLQAQRELGKHFLSHIHEHNEHEQQFPMGDEHLREQSDDDEREVEPRKAAKPLPANDNEEDYFSAKARPVPAPKRLKKLAEESITSWWDMPTFRHRRALAQPLNYADAALSSNIIHKDDQQELLPLGRYSVYEYKVDLPTVTPATELEQPEAKIMKISPSPSKAQGSSCRKITLSDNIVTTVKSRVSKFMSIISRHMNEWYNTLAKHLDSEPAHARTSSVRVENAIDK